ncbi:transcriptional regulator [Rhodococcus erythropolis]|nr:transcriptional regulator [Rhodococcus erythropolis]
MEDLLQKLGLNAKESRFYLAVLGRGRCSIADAARRAGVSRTSGYDILRRLEQSALVTTVEIGPSGKPGDRGRVDIVANDPMHLVRNVDQQRRVLDELVPQLRAMYASTALRPRVKYFEGSVGIRQALFDTLEWPGPLSGIFSMGDLLTVPGTDSLSEYIDERIRRGIALRVIRSADHDTPGQWRSAREDLRLARHSPSSYSFTMTTIIGASAVAVMSSKQENFAMTIESAEYAEQQQNLFEALWEVSSPLE